MIGLAICLALTAIAVVLRLLERAWVTVRDTGANLYQVHRVTGARRVQPYTVGIQPIDWGWVKTGEWTPTGEPPNRGGTGRK